MTVGKVLEADWVLDNYSAETQEQKRGVQYRTVQLIDTDDDGTYDYKRKAPTFDLRYLHRRDDAVMWVRTVPVNSLLSEKKLSVLLDRYIADVTGAGFEVVFLDGGAYPTSLEKRFAARVLSSEDRRIDGRDALAATLEVVDLDQKELSESAGSVQVRLLVLKTPYRYDVAGRVEMPVLMLVGYSNREQDFAEQLPDFDSLVSRIRFD